MTPERAAGLAALWVRLYTRRLPAHVAERRIGEIDADLHDHISHEREQGTTDGRIARTVLSRMLRGLPADAAWRGHQIGCRTAYRSGFGLALFSGFFLFWIVGAVGLIGESGDGMDRLYAGVLAVGIVGAVVARFRAAGMARALLAMAVVQAGVAVAALIAGKHEDPVTSIFELLGLNAMFIALFTGAALLFRHAARRQAGQTG